MLFHSPVGASPLDVPDDLVQFYIDHGFRPVEQTAKDEKPAAQPRKRAPRKTKTDK